MKTYKLNNVEISEKDLKQLIQDNPELLRESNSVPFRYDDSYYLVDTWGDVEQDYWRDDKIDNYRLDIGNAFKTREEAEKKVKQMQALARVNKYIRENDLRLTDVDWNNTEQSKWSILYNISSEKIEANAWCINNYKILIGDLKSREAGKQVIENCIDDLKIIFDVK
jgi:hypothetical protein